MILCQFESESNMNLFGNKCKKCNDAYVLFEGNQTCWDVICRKWNKIFCCITEVSPANFGYDEWKLEGNESIEY